MTAALIRPRRRGALITLLLYAIVALPVAPRLATQAAASGRVIPLLAFDPARGELAESVVLDPRGIAYISLTYAGEIRTLAPNGAQTRIYLPVGRGGSINGLAVDARGAVYAGVTSPDPTAMGVWQVTPAAARRRVAALPTNAQPNGLAFDKAGALYISDSGLGAIWRVRAGSPYAELWLQHPLLAPPAGKVRIPGVPVAIPTPGANGLGFYGGVLYVATSGQGIIVRIPLRPDGRAGTPTIRFRHIFGDDFAFDVRGNLYVTTDPQNTLVRINPAGGVTVLATAADGLSGPSAAAFGTRPGDRTTLYVSDLSYFSPVKRPGLLKLDVGIPGLSLP